MKYEDSFSMKMYKELNGSFNGVYKAQNDNFWYGILGVSIMNESEHCTSRRICLYPNQRTWKKMVRWKEHPQIPIKMCIWLNKRLDAFPSLYVIKVTHAFYASFQPNSRSLFNIICKVNTQCKQGYTSSKTSIDY